MSNRTSIVVIVGPSGAGKTTLATALRKAFLQKIIPLISTTTAGSRPDHGEGEYRHVTDDEFHTLVQADAFAWTVEYRGKRYGTLWSDIDAILQNRVALCILKPEAADILKRERGQHCFILYITAPEDDRRARLLATRNDTAHIEPGLRESADWDTWAHDGADYILRNPNSRSRAETIREAVAVVQSRLGD